MECSYVQHVNRRTTNALDDVMMMIPAFAVSHLFFARRGGGRFKEMATETLWQHSRKNKQNVVFF